MAFFLIGIVVTVAIFVILGSRTNKRTEAARELFAEALADELGFRDADDLREFVGYVILNHFDHNEVRFRVRWEKDKTTIIRKYIGEYRADAFRRDADLYGFEQATARHMENGDWYFNGLRLREPKGKHQASADDT